MKAVDPKLDTLCINTIRTLSIDAVQKANSGHPGLPLGAAPMAYALWQYHLRHSPTNPLWPNRDRFVLSAGHGSMLLYSLLHLTGYDLTLDDIKSFRQWNSRTPGHPETHVVPGVEATTGPLGQGSANAVGMAITERHLANYFNRPGQTIVDHYTYAIVSDGDLMEGVSAEAASLAGHLGLGKLIYLYDSNGVSLDGLTTLTFSREDVGARYAAYGWHVQHVEDGNTDVAAIDAALSAAKAEVNQPSIIIVKTTIGYGSPHKQGTSEAHGSPLGADEVKLTKKALGWDPERSFYVPDEALANFRAAVDRGREQQAKWDEQFAQYAHEYPELAEEWRQALRGELPKGWDADIPSFAAADAQATRQAGGKVMNAIAKHVPYFLGGDADLSVSTSTSLKDGGSFSAKTGAGRNFHFGVREHAMGSIANGMAYHGGVRPFVSTFFVFSDYMRPAVRLAALNHLPLICVWTHDSIALGEDGPTHQPIEHLMSLRAMPNMVVIRPADANETAEAWRWTMLHQDGPVGIVLSRQKLPVLDRQKATGARRGGYVLDDAPDGKPQAIIIGTGAEVHIALAAQSALLADGIKARVVSLPSWEIFAAQDAGYREQVLPRAIRARVSVEAGCTFGWERWVGDAGIAIGIDRFGASAPGEVNLKELGFTAEHVKDAIRRVLST
ncbi:MAG TPA: transketolase [Candidatus Acidoferrales bacterium]|nr:transketolase [Candidatus Acidoferrales bacterium]